MLTQVKLQDGGSREASTSGRWITPLVLPVSGVVDALREEKVQNAKA